MTDEKIKEIKVNDTGFSGYIAKFNTNCMSKGDITSITCIPSNEGDTGCTCEWVKFSIGINTVDATVEKNESGEQRECVFEIKYKTSESTGCSKSFKIVQGSITPEPPEPGEKLCWRGTDNGTDYYADESDPTKIKKVSNPILLCGCAGDNKGDSIFVSEGLDYSKTGEEGTWNPLTTEGFTVGDGNWCKVQLTTTPLCCGQPSFNVSVLSDFEGTETEHVRSVTFYFKAHTYPSDGKVPACAGDGNPCTYEGAGKELCKSWEYEVRQCALGYCWCGEHSKDSEAKPCGECTNKYRDCTDPYYCGTTPPGECTITGGEAVPAYAFPVSSQSQRIKVGSYSNCSGTLTAEHKSGGDFLNDFEIANGDIKAKVSSTNTDCTHRRVGTYSIKNGSTEIGTLEVTQESFVESTKINGVSLKNHSITIEFDKDGNMKGTYLYEPSFMGIEFSNKPEWLTSIGGSSGVITGTASPNQSADEKGYPIMITIGGCINQENVKQLGSDSPTTECTITGGKSVPGYKTTEKVQVGTHADCSENLTASFEGTGTNFLDVTSFEFSDNGDINAIVNSANPSSTATRSGKYTIKDGSTTVGTIIVIQKPYTEPDKKKVTIKNSAGSKILSTDNWRVLVKLDDESNSIKNITEDVEAGASIELDGFTKNVIELTSVYKGGRALKNTSYTVNDFTDSNVNNIVEIKSFETV